MPDRYADAVRARRVELREEYDQLGGAHRVELRGELALSRIAASGAAAVAWAGLAREARAHVEGAGRDGRERLPVLVAAAVGVVTDVVHGRWVAELGPGVRRIATVRSLPMDPSWPELPTLRRSAAPPAVPEPARGSPLAGAADGVALWRLLLLPLGVLPLLGLPALGGPAFAPLAVFAGVAGIAVAVRSRRRGLERAALRRCIEEALATARAALDADLGRRLLELERVLGAELDRVVARRRGEIAAELRALASDPAEVSGG